MAIDDISLTAGMRANLSSLQNTVSLLNRTQQRLSTGKDVNSALDNPVDFFAAQNLNNRATALAGYKDGMSNAVQTIQAANQGITDITTLLNSAKAIASQVQSSMPADSTKTGLNLNIGNIATGDTIVIAAAGGAVTLTADDTATTDAVTTAGSAGTFGTKGLSASQIASNVSSLINSLSGSGNAITLSSSGTNGTMVTINDSGANLTAAGTTGTAVTDGTAGVTTLAASGERGTLLAQYNSVLTQIDSMANDSSFQGIDLLNNQQMVVSFGSGNDVLTLQGVDSTSNTGLGLAQLVGGTDWAAGDGSAQVTDINTALNTLQSTSSNLSSNLAIINARQDFSTNITNVLQTGADNLTLADTNQEGANMLMLQTQQSLGTTALSLSSQAAQSVLKLFG